MANGDFFLASALTFNRWRNNEKISLNFWLLFIATLLLSSAQLFAATIKLEIEGLLLPASPKTLTTELENKLAVKVLDINVRNTPLGWPILSLEYDPKTVTRDTIESTIASIDDPIGRTYKVHQGPEKIKMSLRDEEEAAALILGQTQVQIPDLKNPVKATHESISSGKTIYENNCAKCHGLLGDGNGPAALSFTSKTPVLYNWYKADDKTDGYLFWMITNGRTDMPPWGLELAETERWNIINYIKTLKKPLKQ